MKLREENMEKCLRTLVELRFLATKPKIDKGNSSQSEETE
jgi:hypothetical protein